MPYTRAPARSAVLMVGAAALLPLVGPSPAAAAPLSATHSAAVAVNAPALFSDSKVYVRKGESVTVGASGTWRHKTGTFGPDGSPDAGSGPCKVAQLTGRVGLFGKTRCFRSSPVTFTSEADGYLLFWMNGGPGQGGTLSVAITGGDPASRQPSSLPRPPISDPAQFGRVCKPPFRFHNEDPVGAKVFTDVVKDIPAWFRGIALDVCSRLYKTPAEARTVTSVDLYLRACDSIAGKWGDREIGVRVCTPYLQKVRDAGQDVAAEVTGIMEHEITHGFQHDDKPDSNPQIGLIEGIADAVRLSAGLIAPSALGEGGSWDSGTRGPRSSSSGWTRSTPTSSTGST